MYDRFTSLVTRYDLSIAHKRAFRTAPMVGASHSKMHRDPITDHTLLPSAHPPCLRLPSAFASAALAHNSAALRTLLERRMLRCAQAHLSLLGRFESVVELEEDAEIRRADTLLCHACLEALEVRNGIVANDKTARDPALIQHITWEASR